MSHLHPAVELRPSPIHHIGLFTAAPIATGEVVVSVEGRTIGDTELASLAPPHSSVALGPGRHLLLDNRDPARFGNHSCDPNTWLVNATVSVARRPIAAGEEITVDYATQTGVDGWGMECRCGSPLCRGTIRGTDWQRPELRARYGTHWTPVLLARMLTD